jgi:hypothetical protein
MVIKAKLIEFKTGKLAMAKGVQFSMFEHLYYVYDYGKLKETKYIGCDISHTDYKTRFTIAVDQALLKSLLRIQHNLHISIDYIDEVLQYAYTITNVKTNITIAEYIYKQNNGYTFTQALENALIHTLNLIK